MRTVVALAVFAAAFSVAILVVVSATPNVAPSSLAVVFAVGLCSVVATNSHAPLRRSARRWAHIFVCSLVLAAIFAGIDFALGALGNSVRHRGELPAALGGLELYHILLVGFSSVAVAGIAGALFQPSRIEPKA